MTRGEKPMRRALQMPTCEWEEFQGFVVGRGPQVEPVKRRSWETSEVMELRAQGTGCQS